MKNPQKQTPHPADTNHAGPVVDEKEQVTVYLPASLLSRIDRLAGIDKRSRTGQVEYLLELSVASDRRK